MGRGKAKVHKWDGVTRIWKTCSVCKQGMPISMFAFNPTKPDGYACCCKACVKSKVMGSEKYKADHPYAGFGQGAGGGRPTSRSNQAFFGFAGGI